MLRGSEYFCESHRGLGGLLPTILIIIMTFPDKKKCKNIQKFFRHNNSLSLTVVSCYHCSLLFFVSIRWSFPSLPAIIRDIEAGGGNLGSPWDELLTKIVVTHCLSRLFVALLLTRGAFLVIGSRFPATGISWKLKSSEIIAQPLSDYRDPRLRDGSYNHEVKT